MTYHTGDHQLFWDRACHVPQWKYWRYTYITPVLRPRFYDGKRIFSSRKLKR